VEKDGKKKAVNIRLLKKEGIISQKDTAQKDDVAAVQKDSLTSQNDDVSAVQKDNLTGQTVSGKILKFFTSITKSQKNSINVRTAASDSHFNNTIRSLTDILHDAAQTSDSEVRHFRK